MLGRVNIFLSVTEKLVVCELSVFLVVFDHCARSFYS